ncbi:unnamed protein product [Leptosia nina]|uniref:Pro-resilin n=1 Tax=Leptosia nina TaxID=320188 RepID=A0AAV1JHV0_9NEOP
MKILVVIILIANAFAEPPVGDSYYPDAQQQSLSQEYGPPGFTRSQNQLSSQYGPPQARSNEYLPPQRSVSQEYGVPTRSFDSSVISDGFIPNQQYGVPSARGSVADYKLPTLSQEYGLPSGRSDGFDQEYRIGSTEAQGYDAPISKISSRKSFQKHGPPARIDTSVRDLSRQYGLPKPRSQSNAKSQIAKSADLAVPQVFKARSFALQDFDVTKSIDSPLPSDSYGAPLQRSFGGVSSEYGVPRSLNSMNTAFRSQSVSQTNGHQGIDRSIAKNARFGTESYSTVSPTYGAPRLSTQYGVPSTSRSAFQKPRESYGVPNERSLNDVARSKTNAFTSSSYLPPARNAMPATEYGVPDVNGIFAGQGYSYSRNVLDELINQEPANYDFGYKVNDVHTGSDFGHTETRQENKAEGSYFVVLPDGTKQVVEYEADDQGFRPRISVEAVETQGYDENAADLSRSGPY